jgi:hypothetical protein
MKGAAACASSCLSNPWPKEVNQGLLATLDCHVGASADTQWKNVLRSRRALVHPCAKTNTKPSEGGPLSLLKEPGVRLTHLHGRKSDVVSSTATGAEDLLKVSKEVGSELVLPSAAWLVGA